MPHWQQIISALREHEIDVSGHDMPRPVAGGDISEAWRINATDRPVFLKTGPISCYDMFLAEAEGLRALAAADAIRVPRVLGCVSSASESVLALEWIEFEPGSAEVEGRLGELLAKQHQVCADQFGFSTDNTIGSTPQQNSWSDDWVEFYAEQRLVAQLELAAANGHSGLLQVNGRRVVDNLGQLFSDYWPEASLLHGDLWSGNWAVCDGEPVIFDPAVYYGDRESDLAMTKLFGGFSENFYAAYEDAWPLADGFEQRVAVYQLYHVLNHLNLFGEAYLQRANSLMRTLI